MVASDVYTRKVAIQPVKTKSAETVRGAMRNVLKDLDVDEDDQDRRPALIRTDQGKEFASLNEGNRDIHQARDVRDANGLAVVDKAIQSIKRDLAAEVGKKKGTRWADVAEKVVEDHNDKPNPAVFGPPDSVATNPIQQFKVLQQNAKNYAVDKKNTERQKNALREADYFREPIDNGGRSFKPAYGPPQKMENVDSQYVYHKGFLNDLQKGGTGEGYKTLMKQAKPATEGQFKEKLTLDTDKVHSFNQVKTVLKSHAQALENELLKNGVMKTSELQRKVPGLRRAVGKYKNLTDTNWLTKVYKDKFTVENGEVRLKRRPGSAPAAAAPASSSDAPPVRIGGSSSSRALPEGYSVPALVFRGVVEQPKTTRAAQQEAKKAAEALKEQRKQERLSAWAEREKQKQLKQIDRFVKRST